MVKLKPIFSLNTKWLLLFSFDCNPKAIWDSARFSELHVLTSDLDLNLLERLRCFPLRQFEDDLWPFPRLMFSLLSPSWPLIGGLWKRTTQWSFVFRRRQHGNPTSLWDDLLLCRTRKSLTMTTRVRTATKTTGTTSPRTTTWTLVTTTSRRPLNPQRTTSCARPSPLGTGTTSVLTRRSSRSTPTASAPQRGHQVTGHQRLTLSVSVCRPEGQQRGGQRPAPRSVSPPPHFAVCTPHGQSGQIHWKTASDRLKLHSYIYYSSPALTFICFIFL